MTAAELKRLESAHRRADSAAQTARKRRNAGIVIAAADGVSVPEIARTLGLTRERVRQIIERGND